jgi:hypothetical protein
LCGFHGKEATRQKRSCGLEADAFEGATGQLRWLGRSGPVARAAQIGALRPELRP